MSLNATSAVAPANTHWIYSILLDKPLTADIEKMLANCDQLFPWFWTAAYFVPRTDTDDANILVYQWSDSYVKRKKKKRLLCDPHQEEYYRFYVKILHKDLLCKAIQRKPPPHKPLIYVTIAPDLCSPT